MRLIKNAKRILIVFVFIFVYAVLIFYNDANEEKKFYYTPGYSYKGIEILDNNRNSDEDFEKLYQMAADRNVILSKTDMEYKNDKWIFSLYISLPNIESIAEFYNLNYEVKNNNATEYASTLEESKNPAKYKLFDFLKNKDYNIYTMDQLSKNGKYPYATYLVYYSNQKEFDSFINEAEQLFSGLTISDADMMDFHESTILMIGLTIFLISFLIYIVIEIFNSYKQARKISIMQLQGLSDFEIFKKIISKDILLYISVPIILFILSWIILQNITMNILFQMAIVSLTIVIIFCLLTYLSIIVINHCYNIIGLLKNHQIINHLLKVGILGKFILNLLFIGAIMATISSGEMFFEQNQKITSNKEIADYGFFSTVHMANDQVNPNDHSNLNKLIPILDEVGIKYQYIECSQYNVNDKKDITHTNQAIENGGYYPIISVDVNYLKKNKVKVFDENGKHVAINEESYERFLFPKAYANYHDSFVNYYKAEQSENSSVKSDFTLFTYEADKLPTLTTGNNRSTYLQSNLILKQPIIRIIYKSYANNYIEDPYGLSIAGIGYDVALKIDTDYDKATVYNKLLPEMKKQEIDKILSSTSFVTIGELEGESFANAQLMFYIESIVLILVFAVYTILTFEINCLYIEKEKRKLIVQSFLGHKFGDMFTALVKYNIDIIFLILIIAIVINFFVTPILNLKFIVIIVCMLLYEQIIVWLSARQIKLDNIPKMLKGE